MKVDVQLLGFPARFSPTGKENFRLELGETEATVAGLLQKIGFPADLQKMVAVNGYHVNPSAALKDGDDVFIFSPAAGG